MSNIFVFGSNLAGLHYGGSAKEAVNKQGAIMGVGVGPQGNSYAIPTLDADFKQLQLWIVKGFVDEFIDYAKENPDKVFDVVAIGCGIAGFTPEQIAPMFKDAPNNCNLSKEFKND